MAVKLQVSQVIDRPVADVFRFFAIDHVRNHPRWDPDIQLKQVTDGPIGVGTVIHRRSTRTGTPVEGTMQVVEFELNRVIAMLVHDGPVELRGRTTFEAVDDNRTLLTQVIEIPAMDASTDTSLLISQLERSGQTRKRLIESEL